MCGRYTLTDLPEVPALAEGEGEFSPRYNIAPTNRCPVITQEDPSHIHLYRWGLVPFWAKDIKIGYRMINARSETLAEKSSFRNPLKRSRCLVLADGFYEWKKQDGKKQPYRIVLKDQSIFTFAGLYDRWRDPEGNFLYSFTIITTEPNELMVDIHDRMPVLLDQVAGEQWLHPGLPQEDALALLRPFNPDLMSAYPVSAAVGNVRNDEPSLIEPIGN
jgi:putative SOS response-associated peptidase YedK